MSSKDRRADDEKPKKKGGKLKLIIGAVLLLGLGAGGAYGAVAMGMIGQAPGEEQPDMPKLITKDETDPYSVTTGGEGEGQVTYGEGGSEYRTTYYSFKEGFTSNLKDSPGLVQVSLAASTRHDGRVIQWLQLHETAIRSAILVELADTLEDEVYTVEGKQRLQDRITEAVNKVLEDNEGFGGVDAIHFQTFLVQ